MPFNVLLYFALYVSNYVFLFDVMSYFFSVQHFGQLWLFLKCLKNKVRLDWIEYVGLMEPKQVNSILKKEGISFDKIVKCYVSCSDI